MNTALLIIDVQQSLVEEGIWEAERVITRINRLITAARSENMPLIFVRDVRVGPDGSFHRSLDRQAHGIEIVKRFSDSFMETSLDEVLRDKDVARLIVCGMQSDFCVDTTCRQAATHGYDVVLVADAHSTMDHEYLQAEQIVAHHNRILRNFDSARGRVRLADTATVFDR
jgi:nicotinamidase-related amidase